MLNFDENSRCQKKMYLHKPHFIIAEFSASSNYEVFAFKNILLFKFFPMKHFACMSICRVVFIPYFKIKLKINLKYVSFVSNFGTILNKKKDKKEEKRVYALTSILNV